jgi:hypothetical protein
LVKRYILNNADRPERVEFLRWGPHLYNDEWVALVKESGVERPKEVGPPEADLDVIVRVVHRAEVDHWTREFDELFVVRRKLVLPLCRLLGPFYQTEIGDDWKTKLRKELAKTFPAIKVD